MGQGPPPRQKAPGGAGDAQRLDQPESQTGPQAEQGARPPPRHGQNQGQPQGGTAPAQGPAPGTGHHVSEGQFPSLTRQGLTTAQHVQGAVPPAHHSPPPVTKAQ